MTIDESIEIARELRKEGREPLTADERSELYKRVLDMYGKMDDDETIEFTILLMRDALDESSAIMKADNPDWHNVFRNMLMIYQSSGTIAGYSADRLKEENKDE